MADRPFKPGDHVTVGRGRTIWRVEETYRVVWDLGPRVFADLWSVDHKRRLYTVAVETLKRTRRKV